MGDEEPPEEQQEEPKGPTKPDEYRERWQPTLEQGPSGLTVLMGWLDPLEYLLLYIDEEKVTEYEQKAWTDVDEAARKKIAEDEVQAQITLLSTIIKEPKVVDGPAKNQDELSFQEIRPLDRRFLLRRAQEHIGLAGREAELTKFRVLQQSKGNRGPRKRKIQNKTKQPPGPKS